MAAVTQHRPHDALAGRRFGSFSGKTATAGSAHPVGRITQYRPHGAVSGRRFGSFAGKTIAGSGPVITSFAPGSGTTLVVAWTGTATEYRLDGGTATALPDGTSPDTITGLTAATTYTIELRDGAGAWSASASGTTDNTGSGGGGLSFSGGSGAAVSIAAAGGGSALYTGSGGAGAAVTITAAGGGTAVALQRVVRLFLTSDFSAAYPTSTSWHYALHESADPATWGAPLLQGSDGTIDAAGDFLLNVTSTALAAGDMPGLVLTDGTTDSTLPIVAFVGPVLVTEE